MESMNLLLLAKDHLLSPMVLCFCLGYVATFIKSDLQIPGQVYQLLTLYLLFALGLKGGVALTHAPIGDLIAPAAATLILGALTPLVAYAVARRIGKLNVADSAALAAHYGSVSVVTFMAVLAFLDNTGQSYEGFMSTLVVILEVPAIIIALSIAKRQLGDQSLGVVLKEIVSSKSIVLLLGGLIIGFLSGDIGYKRVAPLFGDPFQGVVTLFLLEMGLVAAKRVGDLKKVGGFVVIFGIVVPVINGCLGLVLGSFAGLSQGGLTALAAMAASASYIAAPAAVRLSLPEANPGIYLTAALTVTFPFNLIFGIPLYSALARFFYE